MRKNGSKKWRLLKGKSLPLGWRISLSVSAITAVLGLIIILLILPFQYGRVENEALTEARILAEAVSVIYTRLGHKEPHDYARRLLLRVSRTPHISMVSVHDKEGVVRYSTDSRELGKKYSLRHGIEKTDDELLLTHVVANEQSKIGSVSVVLDKEVLFADTRGLFIQITIGLFAIILVLTFLMKGMIEIMVTSRLHSLLNVIENAEKGSFLIRAEMDRDDEIGHVVYGFNHLLGVITQIEARRLEKEHGKEDAAAQKDIRDKLEDALFNLEQSNKMLKDKVKAQELLMDSAHWLGGTLKREAVVERLLNLVVEKLAWPKFAIFLADNKKTKSQKIKYAASHGFSEDELPREIKIQMGDGIVGLVAQTGAPIVIHNIGNEKPLKLWNKIEGAYTLRNLDPHSSIISIPLIHKGRVIGVFLALQNELNAFDEEDVTLMSALAAQTALAIVNAELYEATLELATFDPLTGILNRRAMVKRIKDELARSQRFNHPFALLLVDVDHFKAYNDRMGHVLGDVALKEIAKTLKNNIRKVDTLARFGGEEFCVILPQSDLHAAREVANKLCEAVRRLKLRGVEKQKLGHLSISIGITTVSNNAREFDEKNAVTQIIAAADRALYEAKRLGRDRFISNTSLNDKDDP